MKARRVLVTLAVVVPLFLAGCTGSPQGTSSQTGSGKAGLIALSNSFIGNSWRKTMVTDIQTSADEAKAQGLISDFTVSNANNDAAEQISQIQALILKKPSAILVDAASPTALNGVITQACNAGINVITFDGTATAECAYRLAPNWPTMGYDVAKYVFNAIGGKGNVLYVRGVAGTDIDAQQYEGWKKAQGEFPNVKIVGEVYGDWDDATAQTAVGGIIATLPTVDAVVVNGGGYGVAQAFSAANRPTPIIYIGGRGSELAWWKTQRDQHGYVTQGTSNGPSIGQAAFWVAVNMANGVKFPKDIEFPLLTITNENLDKYVADTPLDSVAQQLWTNQMVMDQFALK